MQRALTHDWYSGSWGRSHHRGSRKAASASTSDDDGPLITRWWWPRPRGHHRQKQHATERQESSKPVGGLEGDRVSLLCDQLYILVCICMGQKSCAIQGLAPKEIRKAGLQYITSCAK